MEVLELDHKPESLRHWLVELVRHREVLLALSAKEFKVRYKRASFGVLWAVALPLLQAAVMVFVFGKLGFRAPGLDYTGYVVAGITAWAYAAVTIPVATGGIVEGAGLTDKVWFPRALLVLAPVVANVIGLGIGMAIVGIMQIARGKLGAEVVFALPAAALMIALVAGLTLVTGALYVWFRDIKFVVQAAMMILFYATPILYEGSRLGSFSRWVPVNPFAGAVNLFQHAFTGYQLKGAAVASSVGWTVGLLVIGAMLHRRHDRLFVDLL